MKPAKHKTAPLPVLIWQRPRCPRCGGMTLRKYRTIANQGDGSSAWWVECKNPACKHRFRIVWE